MVTKAKEEVEVAQPAASEIYKETLKLAFYGQYGSRKTLQIGELIDLYGAENVMVVSAERGLNTIKSKLTVPANVIAVTGLPDVRQAWGKAKEFARPDRFVCIDGMSEITTWIANEQLSGADRYYEAKLQNREPAQTDLQFGRYIQRGEINTMAVYGRVGRDSENLIGAWINLPVNLYANYLEDKTGSSGFEKTLPWGPDVPGRVGLKAVMSSFDFVGRLFYNERGELCAGLDAAQANYYMARTREDRSMVEIPKMITNFSLAEFVKLVRGEKAAEAVA
jgi:hypothetical protein